MLPEGPSARLWQPRRKRGASGTAPLVDACDRRSGCFRLPAAIASTHDPLAYHAQTRFFDGQGAEPRGWDPRESMRFVADPEPVVLGLNEEAYVEVQVGWLAATGRNPVHVDVEDGVVERPHVESGLLSRFAQCDRKGIGVSVAVTTWLEPAPELAMVRKEYAVARPVHEPRRARDVADPAGRWKQSGCESTKASKRATVADSCGHRPRYSARSAFSSRRCIGRGAGERSSA